MDLKKLHEIIGIMEQRAIYELELEEEGVHIKLKRGGSPTSGPVVAQIAQPIPAVITGTAAAPSSVSGVDKKSNEKAESEEEGTIIIPSPIVGTFYRAPDPNSPPFVNVGDRIRIGQVLCIVEAMKLMNEIEAETAGVIAKIHQENGQPVQFGAPLFSIRPE